MKQLTWLAVMSVTLFPFHAQSALVKGSSMLPVKQSNVENPVTNSQIDDAVLNTSVSKTPDNDYRDTRSELSPSQEKREAAFNILLEQSLPLSPDQIKKLHRLYDLSERAIHTTPKPPPTPVSSSLSVKLDPGNTPPLIRLSAGFVSSLVFTDATGEPWPITSYDVGDPKTFSIMWDTRGNTLFLQSLQLYAHGNLAIRLQDLNTPIMVSLVSGGQKEVDYRTDLQVSSRGPNAKAPIMQEQAMMPSKINRAMINMLDGVAPVGSLLLEVPGLQGKAWLSNNRLYLRTSMTVISPAWLSIVSSPDGTHVYEMSPTPLVLATHDGRTVNIQIKGL